MGAGSGTLDDDDGGGGDGQCMLAMEAAHECHGRRGGHLKSDLGVA